MPYQYCLRVASAYEFLQARRARLSLSGRDRPGYLFEVRTATRLTMAAACGLLMLVVSAAIWIPARRATQDCVEGAIWTQRNDQHWTET